MSSDRRKFMQLAGATAAVAGAAWAATPVAAQTAGQFKAVKALAFDAYGTLFDVFSVTALCEQLYPGKGNQLAQIWRAKQLQYSLMRSLMGRHRDFWGLTEDGLVWPRRRNAASTPSTCLQVPRPLTRWSIQPHELVKRSSRLRRNRRSPIGRETCPISDARPPRLR
jgi:hypothetical protein